MHINKITRLALLGVCALTLWACKPSERNYRLAYETAQQKARAGIDDDIFELMQAEELPPWRRTATDSVRTIAAPVIWHYTPAAVDSGGRIDPAPYNLIVGKYSMPTNARAQADRLATQGYRSHVLRTGQPIYYVVAVASASLDTIASAAHDYARRFPKGIVALPQPLCLIPQGR